MKFSATFQLAQVDIDAYKIALQSTMLEALAKATFEYLNAILSIIPVWSGASRATFLQLASQISMIIPIEPVAWSGTGTKNHPSHAALLNRIPLGQQCGSSRMIIDVATGQFFTEYTNDLHYLTFNEYNNANAGGDPAVYSRLKNPGPYNFQARAGAAFENSARYARLPSPWSSLKITTRSFGGGR